MTTNDTAAVALVPSYSSSRRAGAALLERDRLGRFLPALLGLMLLSAGLEAVFALILDEAALAAAAASTGMFALALVLAGQQIRAGHVVPARIAMAISLTLFAALGAYLIPGIAGAIALLPIVSVVIVLPHLPRGLLVPVVTAAAAAIAAILMIGELPHQLPAIAGLPGRVFQNGILVGVSVLVLAGLVDLAMDARDSLGRLGETMNRQLLVTAERLALVRVLRTLHAQPTSEATANLIAAALSDLPLVDLALVLEATDEGLRVLAAAGHETHPVQLGDQVPTSRATYLLERSRDGAWAELWVDRPGPGLEDERLSQLGVQGEAFAPILAGERIVGLICIATTDRDQASYLVADLPSVSEAAAVAAVILAPALLVRRDLKMAEVRVMEAIASGAFHSVFQPIVDLQTGQTVGYEALTRFAAGEPPDRMFADAVRAGVGAQLETATLAAAVRDATYLPPGTWLSLNVSPSLLGECAALEALLRHRTRSVVLEVTEHDIIDDYARLHASMRRLGPDVRLAVDDAGAGAANFGHLVELRPDIVKIDAGLVHGVNADVSRQALIAGLVHFAAVAGSLVLAEGVETEAEHATVKRLGVTLGQGYYLGRPAPVVEWVGTIEAQVAVMATGKLIAIGRRASS